MFISFEGPDGGGKTTQVQLLTAYLIQAGFSVVCTREPGGTRLGNAIRSLLLDPDGSMGARTETLLYMAARAEHVDRVIRPALANGQIIISDRYADSTFIYQGIVRSLSRAQLDPLHLFATQGVMPDLTIILDGDCEELRRRMSSRGPGDRLEQEGIEFQRKVRQGFIDLARQEPQRMKLIDACRTVQEVQQDIQTIVCQVLHGRII